MTALIVVGGIIAIILLFLMFSLTAYVSITDEVRVWVGAFGYRKLIDFDDVSVLKKEKKVKKKLQKGKKKHQQIKAKGQKKKISEKTFAQTIEFSIALVKSIAKPTIKLLKHIRIKRLSLYMTVCADDADQTAIRYGQISMGIYNLLGQLDQQVTLKVKSVDIIPDFVSDEAVYDISFKVKLRLWYIIGAFLCMIIQFLRNTIKNNKAEKAV